LDRRNCQKAGESWIANVRRYWTGTGRDKASREVRVNPKKTPPVRRKELDPLITETKENREQEGAKRSEGNEGPTGL